MGNRRRRGPAACLLLWFLMGFDLCCASLNHEGLALLRLREMVEADPSGALAGWDEADAIPCLVFSSVRRLAALLQAINSACFFWARQRQGTDKNGTPPLGNRPSWSRITTPPPPFPEDLPLLLEQNQALAKWTSIIVVFGKWQVGNIFNGCFFVVGVKMVGSFITRALILVLGYAYPAYDCYKTVELNRPEIEQLRFWCQYWILLAMLTVFERVGDNFISWLPMYSEAKHESEIDRNLLELRTRASDMAVVYFHKVADYSQTRFHEILQYIASQSQAQRSRSQEMPRCYVMYVGRVPGVYEEWKDCQKQVNNFSDNNYQGYESREVAEEKWRRHGRKKWRNFLVITTLLLFIAGYVFYFI